VTLKTPQFTLYYNIYNYYYYHLSWFEYFIIYYYPIYL